MKKIPDHIIAAACVIGGIIIIISSILRFYPDYTVWSQGKYGEAELKKAEWNRQIVIKEALAKKEAAIALASAEIERARGVAEANRIIGESLRGNDGYLRYLWINNLENANNSQVIYIPTEAGLPILEAGRLDKSPKISEPNNDNK